MQAPLHLSHVTILTLVAQMVKNPPALLETGLIPGLERSHGEGNGYLLRYSCLEYPMDRGAWWAAVRGVTKRWTRLSDKPHIVKVKNKSESRD